MSDHVENRQGPSMGDLELSMNRHQKEIAAIFDIMAAKLLAMKKELDTLRKSEEPPRVGSA